MAMKVLLVDDSKMQRWVIQRDLIKAGFAVVIAGDGEERRRVGARLEAIVQDFRDAALDDADNGRELDEATDDEMFSVVEKELGIDELD